MSCLVRPSEYDLLLLWTGDRGQINWIIKIFETSHCSSIEMSKWCSTFTKLLWQLGTSEDLLFRLYFFPFFNSFDRLASLKLFEEFLDEFRSLIKTILVQNFELKLAFWVNSFVDDLTDLNKLSWILRDFWGFTWAARGLRDRLTLFKLDIKKINKTKFSFSFFTHLFYLLIRVLKRIISSMIDNFFRLGGIPSPSCNDIVFLDWILLQLIY